MNQDDKLRMVEAMETFGGGFVKALGRALVLADGPNRDRLLAAFPDLVKRYGPGSEFFARLVAADAILRASA